MINVIYEFNNLSVNYKKPVTLTTSRLFKRPLKTGVNSVIYG